MSQCNSVLFCSNCLRHCWNCPLCCPARARKGIGVRGVLLGPYSVSLQLCSGKNNPVASSGQMPVGFRVRKDLSCSPRGDTHLPPALAFPVGAPWEHQLTQDLCAISPSALMRIIPAELRSCIRSWLPCKAPRSSQEQRSRSSPIHYSIPHPATTGHL